MDNYLEILNPANISHITKPDIEAMRGLSVDEINELAKKYPNTASGNGYLILFDTTKSEKDQTYPVSTWQNLSNLHKYQAKNFIPYSFSALLKNNRVNGNKPIPKIEDVNLGTVEGFKKMLFSGGQVGLLVSDEILALEKQLAELKENKAHHLTIKKLEKQLNELKNKHES